MKKLLVGTVVIFSALFVIFSDNNSIQNSSLNLNDTVIIGVDHEVYDNLNSLKAKADIIVRGKVIRSETIKSKSLGIDEDGTSIPSLPRTNSIIKVREIIKGHVRGEPTITISQLGGLYDNITYQVEGLEPVQKEDEVMLFLKKGSEGIYYPLAGGKATAKSKGTGYTLPKSITKSNEIHLNNKAQEVLLEKL